jgi:hypothetical protein
VKNGKPYSPKCIKVILSSINLYFKLKILIAASGFYPENSPRSFRASELAKELARQGHDVTVITKNRGKQAIEYCNKHSIKLRELPALRWRPVPIPSSGVFNLLARIISRILLMLLEYPDLELMFKYKRILKRISGYDLLISIAVPYPVHWGVAAAWNKNLAKRWVADCGDPYMGDESDSFRRLFYFKYIEKWMFRKVDFITIPIETARRAYYPEFHQKIKVIPQGFKFEEIQKELKPYQPNTIPTFAYAGSFIPNNRDPRALLNYLLQLDLNFKFIVYTATPHLITPYAQQSRGRIVVYGLVPRIELIQQLSQMDFLLNIENTTTVQMPSKLIDYFLASRPVLSLPSNVVKESSINQFLDGNYSGKFNFMGYEQYRIEQVCELFLKLMTIEK